MSPRLPSCHYIACMSYGADSLRLLVVFSAAVLFEHRYRTCAIRCAQVSSYGLIMSKVNYLKDIRSAFESRGYGTAEDAKIFSPGDIWYKHQSSTESLVHVVNLNFKPSSRSYSVHVGVFNPFVKNIVFSEWAQLKNMINPLRFNEVYLYYYCWHKFDAGRALQWDLLYLLPDPFDRESWRARFDSLFLDFIDKYFYVIKDDVGIFRLLLGVHAPFEWQVSNPILRAAEVVVLGKNAGIEKDEVRRNLVGIPDLAMSDLAEFMNWNDKVDTLLALYY